MVARARGSMVKLQSGQEQQAQPAAGAAGGGNRSRTAEELLEALLQVQIETLVETRMLSGTLAVMARKTMDGESFETMMKYGPAWEVMASALVPATDQDEAAAAAAAEQRPQEAAAR